MKPLATPVLGGMVSSLGLVLIVTPVIFSWLRERDLRRAEREARGHHPNHDPGRRWSRRTDDNKEDDMAKALLVIVAVGALMTAGVQSAPAADMKPIRTQKVKDVVVTLESEDRKSVV